MKRPLPFISLLLVLALFLGTKAKAQSVDSIIQKNIEARGGLKLIQSITSIEMSGHIVFHNLNAPFTYILKRPDQMRLAIIVNADTLIEAYDGNNAWASIPKNGRHIIKKFPPSQSNSFKDQANFEGPLIDYKQKGYSIENKGVTKIGSRSAYQLQLTNSNGEKKNIFIDTQNFQNIRETSSKSIKGSGPANMNIFRIITNYSNFKSYHGLTLPYEINTIVNGNAVNQMSVKKVALNVKIPEKLFQYPGYMNEQ